MLLKLISTVLKNLATGKFKMTYLAYTFESHIPLLYSIALDILQIKKKGALKGFVMMCIKVAYQIT